MVDVIPSTTGIVVGVVGKLLDFAAMLHADGSAQKTALISAATALRQPLPLPGAAPAPVTPAMEKEQPNTTTDDVDENDPRIAAIEAQVGGMFAPDTDTDICGQVSASGGLCGVVHPVHLRDTKPTNLQRLSPGEDHA